MGGGGFSFLLRCFCCRLSLHLGSRAVYTLIVDAFTLIGAVLTMSLRHLKLGEYLGRIVLRVTSEIPSIFHISFFNMPYIL